MTILHELALVNISHVVLKYLPSPSLVLSLSQVNSSRSIVRLEEEYFVFEVVINFVHEFITFSYRVCRIVHLGYYLVCHSLCCRWIFLLTNEVCLGFISYAELTSLTMTLWFKYHIVFYLRPNEPPCMLFGALSPVEGSNCQILTYSPEHLLQWQIWCFLRLCDYCITKYLMMLKISCRILIVISGVEYLCS